MKSNSGNIPTVILKGANELIYPYLTDCINSAIYDGKFPDEITYAELIPVYKNDDSNLKESYRPISVLPAVPKVYEKVLKDQISPYFHEILSNILCGFRAGHSTQHALIRLLEKWRCLDRSGLVGTILMDFSKAYDCLPHDLLITKLAAYGLDISSLRLLYSYLSNRYQRVKIGSHRSAARKIKIGVPQESVLGPLLFKIFITDVCLINLDSEICNFADGKILYSCGHDLQEIVTNLENDLCKLLRWFKDNGMVANPKKFQLLFLGMKTNRRLRLHIEGKKLDATDHVKLLGIKIDSKLMFSKHVELLCYKVNKKITAFSRLNNFITTQQAQSIYNAIILSNFNYCPLIWMFCNKGANKQIDRTHKRALQILYKDYESSFEALLTRSGNNSIHVNNLQKLMIEIFKTMNGLNPPLVWEFHERKSVTYNLRIQNLCKLPPIKTMSFGLDSISIRGSFLWNTLDNDIKREETLACFPEEDRQMVWS